MHGYPPGCSGRSLPCIDMHTCVLDAYGIRVPARLDAAAAAYALRNLMLIDGDGLPDLWGSLERLEWRVELRELRAAHGGLQACLVPLDDGTFSVAVDDRPSPSELHDPTSVCRGRRAPLVRFRLAHELAHAFHYLPGTPPVRRGPPAPSEESWCDLVASLLLVPPDVTSPAVSLPELASAMRVPLLAVQLASRFGEEEAA